MIIEYNNNTKLDILQTVQFIVKYFSCHEHFIIVQISFSFFKLPHKPTSCTVYWQCGMYFKVTSKQFQNKDLYSIRVYIIIMSTN